MNKERLKKSLAGISIAALVAGGAVATSCSKGESSCGNKKQDKTEQSSDQKQQGEDLKY